MDKKGRKMLDQMYDCVKLHNSAWSNACRPVRIAFEIYPHENDAPELRC